MCIVQLSQLIVMYVIPAGMCGTVIPVAVLMCGMQQQLQKNNKELHHVHACTLRMCTARAHARVQACVHRVSRYQVVWHQSI